MVSHGVILLEDLEDFIGVLASILGLVIVVMVDVTGGVEECSSQC